MPPYLPDLPDLELPPSEAEGGLDENTGLDEANVDLGTLLQDVPPTLGDLCDS